MWTMAVATRIVGYLCMSTAIADKAMVSCPDGTAFFNSAHGFVLNR